MQEMRKQNVPYLEVNFDAINEKEDDHHEHQRRVDTFEDAEASVLQIKKKTY